MKNKVLDIIGIVIICITVVILNLIIGANEKGLRILPISIIFFLMFFYLLARKLILKQKIVIKNRVDVFVLLFVISTLFPYLFRTYCTYQGTIEFIIKYFFVYTAYLTIRNTVDSKKKVDIIILVTLLSSLMIAVFGIDRQSHQYFRFLLEKLNLRYTDNYALFSTFGYPNTVAIYFSFCIFLAIHQIQCSRKKIVKFFCFLYLFVGFYIVYKTLSRSVFVLLIVAICCYFIFYYFHNILKVMRTLSSVTRYILVLFIIVAATTFCFLLRMATTISKPYEFTDIAYQRNFNYHFEPEKEYTISLDLETKSGSFSTDDCFRISVLEINQYFNQEILATKTIQDFDGTEVLTFTTSSDLYTIDLLVENLCEGHVSLRKCYINDEEYPLNYKFLPYEIGKAITMYSATDKSLMQRLDMWQDCIKIAKMSPIIGQGGDTWKKLSQAVQEYPYGMKESHSYFFELLISYGVVGVILYLLLMVVFHIDMIKGYIQEKKRKKNSISILIGLDMILLHSLLFDFDMSFLVILFTVFGYMALLMYDTKEQIFGFGNVDYFVFAFLSILLVVCIMTDVAKYGIHDEKLKSKVGFYVASYQYDYIDKCVQDKEDFRYVLNRIQLLTEKEPYYFQNELYDQYWDLLLDNLNQLDMDELASYISFINLKYTTAKPVSPMFVYTVFPRVYTMQRAYLILDSKHYDSPKVFKQIHRLKEVMQREYDINISNLKAKERNGYDQENIDNFVREYDRIIMSLQ